MYTARAEFDQNRAGVSHPHRISYSIHSIDDIAARDMFRIDQKYFSFFLVINTLNKFLVLAT